MKKISCLLLLSCIALTSCAHYYATPLRNPPPHVIWKSKKDPSDDVVMCATTYNKQDCKQFLDRNVIRKGYYPIQLYIENNSDKDYIFSLSRVGLPCARPEEVAERVHTSTIGRVTAYSTAAVLTCGLFAIPAVVDGVKSMRANAALDIDFEDKAAKDQVIYKHSHANMLMFVPSASYQSTFLVTLIDEATWQPRTFQVSAK